MCRKYLISYSEFKRRQVKTQFLQEVRNMYLREKLDIGTSKRKTISFITNFFIMKCLRFLENCVVKMFSVLSSVKTDHSAVYVNF